MSRIYSIRNREGVALYTYKANSEREALIMFMEDLDDDQVVLDKGENPTLRLGDKKWVAEAHCQTCDKPLGDHNGPEIGVCLGLTPEQAKTWAKNVADHLERVWL